MTSQSLDFHHSQLREIFCHDVIFVAQTIGSDINPSINRRHLRKLIARFVTFDVLSCRPPSGEIGPSRERSNEGSSHLKNESNRFRRVCWRAHRNRSINKLENTIRYLRIHSHVTANVTSPLFHGFCFRQQSASFRL